MDSVLPKLSEDVLPPAATEDDETFNYHLDQHKAVKSLAHTFSYRKTPIILSIGTGLHSGNWRFFKKSTYIFSI